MVTHRTYWQHAFIGYVLLLSGLSVRVAQAQTVHAIVVADTKDPILYTACQRDVETMHRQFVQLAAAIGYTLSEQVIDGDKFKPKRLTDIIRKLTPKPDDILFLYYTGHGYNSSSRAGRFPVLLLEKNARTSQRNPGLLAVHQLLKAKQARLCVTFGDCCNNLVRDMRGVVKKKMVPKALTFNNEPLNETYRRLFLNVRGDALIASSRPPQQACAHPDSGSFYTRSFDEALEQASLSTETITWESVLKTAQTQLIRHPATHSKQSIYEVTVVTNPPSAFSHTEADSSYSLPRSVSKNGDVAALSVTIRTDKGRENVAYWAGNQLVVEAKVNRPCHLRLVYTLADGTETLIETDLEIQPGLENQFVRITPNVPFICAAPFGTEHLRAYAADEAFCAVPTQPNSTAYVRSENGYMMLVGSTAAVLKVISCTKSGAPIVEDRIQITTRSAE